MDSFTFFIKSHESSQESTLVLLCYRPFHNLYSNSTKPNLEYIN